MGCNAFTPHQKNLGTAGIPPERQIKGYNVIITCETQQKTVINFPIVKIILRHIHNFIIEIEESASVGVQAVIRLILLIGGTE